MTRFREILIATDIERPARAALRCSFFLAEQFHASLHVVHAWGPPEGTRGDVHTSRQRRGERALREQGLRERLDAIVREVPTSSPGRATTEIVDRPLAAAVLACAARQKADLVVLGSTPGQSPRFGALDTTDQEIAREALCPTLTVPHASSAPLQRVQRIVLPLDGRPLAIAVDWAAAFARHFNAVVELLRPGAGNGSDRRTALDRCAIETEEALRVEGVAVEHRVEDRGSDLTECVLERIQRGGCDLVVMNTEWDERGHCAVAHVRRHAQIPVLAIHPRARDESYMRYGAARDGAGRSEAAGIGP
jgi:nucleotide-binding universal stress UspA family protein